VVFDGEDFRQGNGIQLQLNITAKTA
jgi:hypothetical protein